MSTSSSLSSRSSLRLPATLTLMGVVVSFVAGYFHPEHAQPNDHVAAFTEYAHSQYWTLIHLGNFVGMVFIIAGLLALYWVFNLQTGFRGLLSRFAAVASGVALTLYGVLEAVDGVALKQAVNAWANAPEAEKLVRFTSAETVRWLEWALRSYQCCMLGLSFLLFGMLIFSIARIPRWVGAFMGVSGLAYFIQGWNIGTQGFAPINKIPAIIGICSVLIWSISFWVFAFQRREIVDQFSTNDYPASRQQV